MYYMLTGEGLQKAKTGGHMGRQTDMKGTKRLSCYKNLKMVAKKVVLNCTAP